VFTARYEINLKTEFRLIRHGNDSNKSHKCIKVSYTVNIVCLLHVSAPLVAISREKHYKDGHTNKLQTFVNQPTDVKY
jgi:hypothetical protein